MATVEVYEGESETPSFIGDFDFLPRVGEYLSTEAEGYFRYLNIAEVWHRQDSATGRFTACLRVQQDD